MQQKVDWLEQVNTIEQHWLYFFAYGLPCTLLTFFYTPFVATGIYGVIFPLVSIGLHCMGCAP